MLKPIKLKVLILPDGKRKTTESGLVMANYSLEGATRRGTVVAVGDMVRELKEGDRVFWNVEIGQVIKHNDVEYALIYETEIFGKLEAE